LATLEDFKKLDLRIGRILEVTAHPNADRLYVMSVDLGEEKRTLVAGLKTFYTPEELEGKQCVVVANLEPATLRGVQSEGMVLAVKDAEGLAILTPQKEVALGSVVS